MKRSPDHENQVIFLTTSQSRTEKFEKKIEKGSLRGLMWLMVRSNVIGSMTRCSWIDDEM